MSSLLRRIATSISNTWEKYKLKRNIKTAGARAPGIVLASLRAAGRKEELRTVAAALEQSPKPTIGWLLRFLGTSPTSPEGRTAIEAVVDWCRDYARYLQLVDTYGLDHVLNSPEFRPLVEKVRNPPRFFDRFISLFARFRKRNPARLFTATLSILEKISSDLGLDLPTLLDLVNHLEKGRTGIIRELLNRLDIPVEARPAVETVLELARAVAYGRLLTAMNLLTSPSTRELLEKALGESTVEYIGDVIRGLTGFVLDKVKLGKNTINLPQPPEEPELPYTVKV